MLLLQYSHVLMDNKGSIPLLRKLTRWPRPRVIPSVKPSQAVLFCDIYAGLITGGGARLRCGRYNSMLRHFVAGRLPCSGMARSGPGRHRCRLPLVRLLRHSGGPFARG